MIGVRLRLFTMSFVPSPANAVLIAGTCNFLCVPSSHDVEERISSRWMNNQLATFSQLSLKQVGEQNTASFISSLSQRSRSSAQVSPAVSNLGSPPWLLFEHEH
jgi:hypothetical protein